MKISKIKKLLYVFLLITIASCADEGIYQDNIDFENGKWSSENPAKFKFDVSDTNSYYHFVYQVRNNLDYGYYNLYVQYSLKDSLGNKIEGNLQELLLMDSKTGKPFGSGFGTMYDHQFYAMKNFKFENPGSYQFMVRHYMRHDTLEGIYSVGLKLLKSDSETQ